MLNSRVLAISQSMFVVILQKCNHHSGLAGDGWGEAKPTHNTLQCYIVRTDWWISPNVKSL